MQNLSVPSRSFRTFVWCSILPKCHLNQTHPKCASRWSKQRSFCFNSDFQWCLVANHPGKLVLASPKAFHCCQQTCFLLHEGMARSPHRQKPEVFNSIQTYSKKEGYKYRNIYIYIYTDIGYIDLTYYAFFGLPMCATFSQAKKKLLKDVNMATPGLQCATPLRWKVDPTRPLVETVWWLKTLALCI